MGLFRDTANLLRLLLLLAIIMNRNGGLRIAYDATRTDVKFVSVLACECPEKDIQNYVCADAVEVQADGQLKCWYVAKAGGARGGLYCLY